MLNQNIKKSYTWNHSQETKKGISENLLKKGENHQTAVGYSFISPLGVVLTGTNVSMMIKENKHLFSEQDVQYNTTTPKRGYYCKAYSGLMAVKNKVTPAWKGWKAAS